MGISPVWTCNEKTQNIVLDDDAGQGIGERLGEIDMSVKMRTTYTWTERPYEASLFPGIGFGIFLRSLGTTGQGTVSGRQFLWGVGLPKGNGGYKGFLGPDEDWPCTSA
ncbi:hypothetical protein TanjilG_28897 [Lupinus angustifolius]|uniref:Uncharacterized protein n=1 Tax=Lupinus angustifolius TaxID=3871 RepID=A0A394D8K2_LUPAN|nr:hypothetical protein TanjilG_28897 [Lupinus angustifolius]